jgi:pSer/pThr/pTyr-binding forkhead associated (FHA) protein
MRLAYQKEDGLQEFVDLTDKPIIIGRDPDADLVLSDDKISRMHCGIRQDGSCHTIKDLGSRNGTFVNAEQITTSTPLQPGDHIRIGNTLLTVEQKLSKDTETILHEIEEEMDQGKGYRTILQEIIEPDKEEKE